MCVLHELLRVTFYNSTRIQAPGACECFVVLCRALPPQSQHLKFPQPSWSRYKVGRDHAKEARAGLCGELCLSNSPNSETGVV